MNEELLRTMVYAGREARNREYKSAFPWEAGTVTKNMARVIRTMLAMSNLSDGGHIIIGVKEEDTGEGRIWTAKGVPVEYSKTYDYDVLADVIQNYADPYATFDVTSVTLDGMIFVIISVHEFDEFPVICKKPYQKEGDVILSQGSVYVRPASGRPRSVPIPTHADMRELMEKAVDKGVIKFLYRQATVRNAIRPSDEERFEQQIEDFS